MEHCIFLLNKRVVVETANSGCVSERKQTIVFIYSFLRASSEYFFLKKTLFVVVVVVI
jgi:hypothetical protein